MTLTEKAKELIAKSRIVSFTEWQTSHPSEAIEIFQAADDSSKYLTDMELEQIKLLVPNRIAYINVVQNLRDRVAEIIDEAREQVLIEYPDITSPGGSLYPPERAAACWRDFWHFLRCITYGIMGQQTEYTSSEGLNYMKLLYEELQVPLEAMIVRLEGIKTASLKRCEASQKNAIAPYFDHLITKMSAFKY
ncbi:phycobilisome protein [Brunnivagina elsteri]|uniref:Phycobilisome protein n=1 Tax=Brunnivagina elsteri CCALA 953 TaxID=987040 RepID=A0A2A2TAW1_9CYAN|nr:phycobilisome protein [Calothrix elsteri CCALA 953]